MWKGAELDVITGMLDTIKQHQLIIICEVLDYVTEDSKELQQQRANQVIHHMQAMNYSVYRILHENEKALQFQPVTEITLKRWTPESLNLNDYLFLRAHISSLPGSELITTDKSLQD